jgi:hypothetical protein
VRVLHSLHTIDVEPGEIGVTVRLGDKWYDAHGEIVLCVCSARCLDSFTCDKPADYIECDNCSRVGRAQVVETVFCRFGDVPARLIEHEHEERSRLYSGLLASMRKAYGDEFGEEDEVTVLVYRRIA